MYLIFMLCKCVYSHTLVVNKAAGIFVCSAWYAQWFKPQIQGGIIFDGASERMGEERHELSNVITYSILIKHLQRWYIYVVQCTRCLESLRAVELITSLHIKNHGEHRQGCSDKC